MLLVITLNYSISKFRSPLSLQLNEISCECCSDVTSNKEERPQRCSQEVLLLRTRSMCFRLDKHVARLCYDTLLNLSALLPPRGGGESSSLTSSPPPPPARVRKNPRVSGPPWSEFIDRTKRGIHRYYVRHMQIHLVPALPL